MSEYRNVLPDDKRTTIAVHQDLKQLLDGSQPRGLHKHQWAEKVIRAGLAALQSEPIAS